MPESAFGTISREELADKLAKEAPQNEDRARGYALVNVLEPEQFEFARIPGSASIPRGQEEAFEERFAKSKEIIVYCASPQCEASERVAGELVRRGFENVRDYEAGLSDWRDAGRPLAGTRARRA